MDWKSRFRNKTFLVSLFGAIYLLIQQLGYGSFLPENIQDVFNTILTILTILGVVINPTTEGILDKKGDK